MKWIYILDFIVKNDQHELSENGELNITYNHADLMCGFTENVYPEWLENGIRECKKICKEINNSKYKLKKLEKELNDFYKTNYKLLKVIPATTGCYWDYNEETYRFPE